jgi:hypothetical protein
MVIWHQLFKIDGLDFKLSTWQVQKFAFLLHLPARLCNLTILVTKQQFLGTSNWLCIRNIQNFRSQLGYCLNSFRGPGQLLVVLDYWGPLLSFIPARRYIITVMIYWNVMEIYLDKGTSRVALFFFNKLKSDISLAPLYWYNASWEIWRNPITDSMRVTLCYEDIMIW